MKDEPRRSLSGPCRVGCLAPGLGAGPHLLRGFNCSDVLIPYVIAGSSSKDVISLIYKSRFSHSFLDQGRLSVVQDRFHLHPGGQIQSLQM